MTINSSSTLIIGFRSIRPYSDQVEHAGRRDKLGKLLRDGGDARGDGGVLGWRRVHALVEQGVALRPQRRRLGILPRAIAVAPLGEEVAIDPLLPSAIQSSCVAVFLFDQLVRAQQDRCRHIEAKRLGGRHIEHGLVFHRQLHRQIGRLLALKDAVDVGGGAASMAYLVRPI